MRRTTARPPYPLPRAARRALRLGGHPLPLRLRRGAPRRRLGGRAGHARARRPARARGDGGGLPRALSAPPLRARRDRGGRVSGDGPRAARAASASRSTTTSSTASSPPSTRPGRPRGSSARTRTRSSTRSARAGLMTGLVSNAFDPGWLLHQDLADMGLAERLDAAVFSSEVGLRKPHPAIFEATLGEARRRARPTRSSSATAATRTCAARRSSA